MRHFTRLGAAGLLASPGPLFPGEGGGTRSKDDSLKFLRGVLAAAGLDTVYRDSAGVERQTFGGHACRVAGATFLASRGIPMTVIQLLGRWSSRAIERYTQSAPLALAPSAPEAALAGTAGLGQPGGGAQLAVPLAIADAPVDPKLDQGPEHFIYLARTWRVHKPDPGEHNSDRAAWRTLGCGWPYGGRQFFRLSAPPPRGGILQTLLFGGLPDCSEAVAVVSPSLVDLRVGGVDVRIMSGRSPGKGGALFAHLGTRPSPLAEGVLQRISSGPQLSALTPPPPQYLSLAWTAMARPIAEGLMTVPWSSGPTWPPSPSTTGAPSGTNCAPGTGYRLARRTCCAWWGATPCRSSPMGG